MSLDLLNLSANPYRSSVERPLLDFFGLQLVVKMARDVIMTTRTDGSL